MRTIKHPGVREIEVRRSRFICALARATSPQQAREFIAARRRADPAAAHHCTAYVLGEHGEITRNNDDGEPAGTAGPPMLEALTRRGLTGTVAVVTRHFGGVKLGTGGLARAYGSAVIETVDAVGMVERRPVVTVIVALDHALAGRFQRDLRTAGHRPARARYGGDAEFEVPVAEERAAEFEAWAAAVTAGRARTRRGARGHIEIDL